MSTVSTLLAYIKDDIKESGTDRDDELTRYINRVVWGALLPTIIKFRSTIGLTEWYTDEVTENIRIVDLPSSFHAMHSLYCVDFDHEGTATAGTSTTITLASDASSSDDIYNSYYIRITSGTGADQQKVITDYTGSTLAATVNSSWSTNPDSTSVYVIFVPPSSSNIVVQRDVDYVRENYSTTGNVVVYAIDGTTIVLGHIPDSTTRVLQGWYWARTTALSATTDTVPYDEVFDMMIIEYCTARALLRDEYNVQSEVALMQSAMDNAASIVSRRKSRTDRQPKIRGSEDL